MIAEESGTQYQISVFGTPVPMRTIINANTPLEPPVRTYQHNQQCQYEIVFPPGAMGLELEPVITSSERTIGCRVKDFYFGVSYDGINQAYLQEHVMVGDIIAKINDISVVSLPFNNILDMLRSMTSTTRHIVFKNITASWEASYKGSHQQVSPTTAGANTPKASPTTAKGIPTAKKTVLTSKQSDAENSTNCVSAPPAEKISQVKDEPAALAQIRAQQEAAKNRGPEEALQRKLSTLSPKKLSGGVNMSNSTGSNKSGSSKSSGNSKVGAPVLPIPVYDAKMANAKSPPRNRSVQKFLGYPMESTAQFDTMSVAESSVNSPFKLRKPQETESMNNTFTFSVQDVDASSMVSMSSVVLTRSIGAPSSSPSPRAKQQNALGSSGTHAAALLLNRSSTGAAPPARDGCSSPLTPSSILRLKQQQRASGNVSPIVSRVITPPRSLQARTPSGRLHHALAQDDAADVAAPLVNLRMSDIESIVPEDDDLPQMVVPSTLHAQHSQESQSAFAHILDRVRGSIGTGLVQVGNVLGARAEKALVDTSHLLPLYSTTEMNQVMTKKYDLLSELSHSCMLLGLAEEKEKTYAEQLAQMRSLEDQVRDLQAALEEAQQGKESLQFKCKAAETEVSVLKVEKSEDKELLASYQAEIARQNDSLASQAAQLSSLDERLAAAASENSGLRSEWRDREGMWQTQMLTLQEENRVFREQSEAYTAKLKAAETERDYSVAELEVLQEMAAADKQAAMGEFARLREGMASQQYLYKEQLIKHDAAMCQLKRDLSEAQAGLEAITELHKTSEHEKAQLQTKVTSTAAEVLQLTAKYTMCQQDLRASDEAKEYNRKLAVQAQNQLKEQQMQLVISSSEHGMLSDQARLAALTVEALHSEISMLRRDLEVQRDDLNQKDIEVKTVASKHQVAEELIETLRTEMESLQLNHIDDLQGKDEEIAGLQQTVALLREDRTADALEREQLVSTNARLDLEIAQLNAARAARVAELSAELDEAHIRARQLEHEKSVLIAAQQAVVADMVAQLDKLKENSSATAVELSDVQAARSVESAAHADAISALKRTISDTESQFQASLQQRDSELSSVRSKALCVEDTLAQVRQEAARLSADYKQQLARKDEEIVALAEKCQQGDAKARGLVAAHDKAMASTMQKFEQREKEFLSALSLAEDTQDSLRSDLHVQLSQTSKQCSEQLLVIKDLQGKLQEAAALSAGKSEELDLRMEEIALLRSEVQDKDAQIALLESKVTVTSDGAKQSVAQIGMLKDDLEGLKQQLYAKMAETDKVAALAAFQQTSAALKEEKLTQQVQELQAQLEKSADRLTVSNSARRTERSHLCAALQGVQMELVELRSNLKETKVDISGLGGVHASIVRSLWSQNQEAKAELAALLGRQPGTLKLEGRLTQLLQEKEAASRRAAVAEQNTIESEARCVNALTKAMTAEKNHSEAKSTIAQLRESIAALELAVAEGGTENATLTEARDGLTRKLGATSDECAALQRQVHENAQEIEQLQILIREAHTRDKRSMQVASDEVSSLKAMIETLQRERQEWERTASSSQAEQLAIAARFQIQCSALQAQLETAAQRAVTEETRWEGECQVLQHQIETLLASNALETSKLEDQCAALQAQVLEIQQSSLREQELLKQQHTDLQERFVCAQQQSNADKEQLVCDFETKLLNQTQELSSCIEEVAADHSKTVEALQLAHRETLEKEKKAHDESCRSLQQHYKLLVDELTAEKEHVSEMLDATQTETLHLRTALQEAGLAKSTLEQQMTLLSASQSATQQQVVALQNQLSLLQREAQLLKGANEAGAASALQEVSALEKSLHEKQVQVSLLEANLSGLEDSLTESKAAYEVLREKLKQVQNSEDTKGTSLKAAESFVASLQTQLSDLKASHAALRSEHSTVRVQLEELNTDLIAKLEVISTLNASLKEEESKEAQHHGNVAMILKDLEISQERKKELKQQLAHAQLAQRAAEKQSNIFKVQVQELRDTLMTQQNVIVEAETREQEHNSSRRKMELLLSDGEFRFSKLQAEYKLLLERGVQTRTSAPDVSNAQLQAELRKVTARASHAQQALEEKCAELQSLHKHVTELLTSTFIPRKGADRPSSCVHSSVPVAGESLNEDVGKENVLTEVLIQQLQEASARPFEISESAHSDSQWHSRLVQCSLGIYELLMAAFQQLQLQYAVVLTDSVSAAQDSMNKFNHLCICLSNSQHQLHNLLMQAPWMRLPGHAQATPSLTAAHERFHHLIAPSAQVAKAPSAETIVAAKPPGPSKTSAVIAHKAATGKPAICPASPPPVMHSVPLHGSPGADRAEEDDHVRTSNDSATLEDLLASLMCNQSGVSSNNSSVCSALRSHSAATHHHTHRNPGHSAVSSLRNSADEAIFAANAVSAEIDEVSFEVFADLAVGSTPPSIKRIMGAMEAPRSTGSKGSRHSDHDTSFDSVVSDLFNLSADTGCGDSDEESSIFYHYLDSK